MVRAGYSRQDSIRNYLQHFTLGLGFRYKIITFDLAYFIPVLHFNTLQNTFRVTLLVNFLSLKRKETNTDESKK